MCHEFDWEHRLLYLQRGTKYTHTHTPKRGTLFISLLAFNVVLNIKSAEYDHASGKQNIIVEENTVYGDFRGAVIDM